MEQEWKYNIPEKKFWKLGQRVSKFYDKRIDLQGYILTLMEEYPNLDVPNAYRILSNGRATNSKSLSSNSQKNPSYMKRWKGGGRHWKKR